MGSYRRIYGKQWFASDHPVCLSIRSVRVRVMHFCVCPTHSKVQLRMHGQDARFVQIDFSAAVDMQFIWEFSISTVLWMLKVLYCMPILSH